MNTHACRLKHYIYLVIGYFSNQPLRHVVSLHYISCYCSSLVLARASLFQNPTKGRRSSGKESRDNHHFSPERQNNNALNGDTETFSSTDFQESEIPLEDNYANLFLIRDVPLNEERRLSIDDAFLYLIELFGEQLLHQKTLLTAHDEIFPESIHDLSEIIPLTKTIAKIMDIDPDLLEIGFFEAGIRETHPKTGDIVYYEKKGYTGLYHSKNENGKFVVTLSDDIHHDMDLLIATIAHEFAHIKLLGENRIAENSEELTDMLTLIYGLGLFAANMSFKFEKYSGGWKHSKQGYLHQTDWGYLFALYMYVRKEEDPTWLRHLNKTVARDCQRASGFIRKNKNKVLQPLS